MATAHLAGPSTVSGLLTGDDCRWGNPCSSDGVSGNYVNDPADLFLTGGDVFPLTITDVGTVFPAGFASLAFAFCDLEVLSDGTGGPDQILDEEDVDGGPGGALPDGTFDDGGLGGACHTENQYDVASYNSPGCGTPGHAVASDAAVGGSVWIGAGCDDTHTEGDGFSLEGCLVNEIISGGDTDVLIDCVNTFLGSPPTAPTVFCGSDGTVGAINYGPGGGAGSSLGVPFPTTGCPGGGATVFTFNYVSLGGNPGGALPEIVPATAGWIDSRDLADYTAVYGPGITI